MKRRCDKIFNVVNHNPCVGKGTLLSYLLLLYKYPHFQNIFLLLVDELKIILALNLPMVFKYQMLHFNSNSKLWVYTTCDSLLLPKHILKLSICDAKISSSKIYLV